MLSKAEASGVIAGEAILTLFILATPTFGPQYQEAGRTGGRALYKYYHLDEQFHRLEKRWFSPDARKYGGTIISFGRILYEKRVDFQWQF